MASKTTLNAANLQALGAERLAALLIEVSDGNAAIKRRLRLELAGASSPAEASKEIRKRLATIQRSRAFVDWQSRKPLLDDLETQRNAILQQVAPQNPREALDLMWQFLGLARSVYARSDDGTGAMSGVFEAAIHDLGRLAEAARPDPKQLAGQVSEALTRNEYGEYDGLIPALKPALGADGLEHLKQRIHALAAEPTPKPAGTERPVLGYGTSGPIYADDMEQRHRTNAIRRALQDIADAQGDVDGFIALYDEKTRAVPAIAARIARRLLAAGRGGEALQTLDAAPDTRLGWSDFEWQDARIDVLDALGRGDDAQATRWSCFETTLSAGHLRDYLKRLPDFDDFDAEQRALDHAERFREALQALSFLVSWPALDRAARLVSARATEMDGNYYEVLTPAADALAGKYPLAATLLLRAMIDFTLTKARHSRYGHAARHLRNCAGLAPAIPDFGAIETHEAYVARLRREHGRKAGFWQQADR